MRTDKDTYFLDIAERCARQTTCLRRGYGAVIVDINNTIVSTGYNGAPKGEKDCLERGTCWRREHNIPSGSSYEKCLSVHGEQNALLQAGKEARGCTMYIAGVSCETKKVIDANKPCFICTRMIINSEITKVIAKCADGSCETIDIIELYESYVNNIDHRKVLK